MAAVVILEGNVGKSEDPTSYLEWTGSFDWLSNKDHALITQSFHLGAWHFAKDKKVNLSFNYKHGPSDMTIPRDLFDYVSFLEPLSQPATENEKQNAEKRMSMFNCNHDMMVIFFQLKRKRKLSKTIKFLLLFLSCRITNREFQLLPTKLILKMLHFQLLNHHLQ